VIVGQTVALSAFLFLFVTKIKEPTHLPIGRLQVNEKRDFPFTIYLVILYHSLVSLASIVGKKARFFYV